MGISSVATRSMRFFPQLLVSTIIFYFLKVAFWPLTYFFVVSYAIVILIFLVNLDKNLGVIKFASSFWLSISLVLVFIIVYLLNGDYTNKVLQKDIIRIIILFSLFYLSFWSITIKNKSISIIYIYRFIVITLVCISVLNLLKPLFSIFVSSELLSRLNIPDDFSISNDRNFFTLFMLIALITINFNSFSKTKFRLFSNIEINIFNPLLIITILFSASRRGILIFLILLILYLYFGVKHYLISPNSRVLIKALLRLFIGFILILISGAIIVKTTSKEKITMLVYRYASFTNFSDYKYIDRMLWDRKKFDTPKGNHIINKQIFSGDPKLWHSPSSGETGMNQVDTPYGKGYMITTKQEKENEFLLKYIGPEIIYYANHMYKISFKAKIINGDDPIKVGWKNVPNWSEKEGIGVLYQPLKKEKISDDWYQYNAYYTFNNNQISIDGFIYSRAIDSELIIADFTLVDHHYKNGTSKFSFEMRDIQNLEGWINSINPPIINDTNLINNGDFSLGLRFWDYSANELTILVEELDEKPSAHIKRGNGDGLYWSLVYFGRCVHFKKDNEYQISFKYKPISKHNQIPFNVGFYINEGNGWMTNLPKKVDTLDDGWYEIKANYKFVNDKRNIAFPINNQVSNSEFYISDVKLVNLTQVQKMDNDSLQIYTQPQFKTNDLYSSRTDRWLYARDLWVTKYNLNHKIVGHGFDYLSWYGEKFYPDTKRDDWPHNPFITVALYSGILGLILYLLFLTKVIQLYIKHRKKYGLIFMGFLIAIFFSFFSAGNPFDPPIMGFFVMLPFLIDYIHKKDKSN